MYPGKEIQIELDFYHLPGVGYQVGHLGIPDFGHNYWLLVFVKSKSENEDTSFKLLKTAVDLVEEARGRENVHWLTAAMLSRLPLTH